MSDIIKNNWSLLNSRWPGIHRLVESAQIPENVVLDDRYTEHTYVIDNIHLSSTRSSEKEALLQAESIPTDSIYACCYGIGMGDLPRVLLQRKALKTLDVYLFNPGILKLLLDTTDQTAWLSDQRVNLLSASDTTRIITPFTTTPPCLYLATQESWPLRDRVQMELNSRYTARQFRNRKIVQKNIEKNTVFADKDADLKEIAQQYPGETISVVGAGPSLDENLETLRRNKIIICVDRILHTLLSNNIVPTFVTTADPANILTKYNNFNDPALQKIQLVYLPAADNESIKNWPGKRFVTYSRSPVYDNLRKQHPKSGIYISGSVIHMSVDLAVKLGASQIHFYGTDFCYLDNKTHASDTAAANDETIFSDTEVISWNGMIRPTTFNLKGYLTELEDYILKNQQVQFFSISDKGAKIQGVTLLTQS